MDTLPAFGPAEAKFNMAVATLNRINELLIDCNAYARSCDVIGWRSALWSLSREAHNYMKKNDITTNERYILNAYQRKFIDKKRKDYAMGICDGWERFLRGILRPLLMAETRRPEFAMAEKTY